MKLIDLIGDNDRILINNFRCDDIFLLIVEYNYLLFTSGWENNNCNDEKKNVGKLEVNTGERDFWKRLLITWIFHTSSATYNDYIDMILDAEEISIYLHSDLNHEELFKIRLIRKLIEISTYRKTGCEIDILKRIISLSYGLCTPQTVGVCESYLNKLEKIIGAYI